MHRSHVRSEKDSSRSLLLPITNKALASTLRVCRSDRYYLRDRRDDIGIGRTAAEIAAHALADLLIVEGDVLSSQIGAHRAGPASLDLAQHPNRRAELSRRAVAALEGVMGDERLLQRVQVLAISQPLNRDDLGVLVRDGERQAAIDASPVKQDGAGATLPVVAALLGAGEAEPLAQRVQQRR